jgi:hypothetical protein
MALIIARQAMARPDPDATVCEHVAHVRAGAQPFSTVLVLDDVGGVADAIVRCQVCARPYLLELLDWSGPARAQRRYRTSVVDEAILKKYLHNLERGSCDVKRAPAERASFESRAKLSRTIVELDAKDLHALSVETVAADADIPMSSWRERLR